MTTATLRTTHSKNRFKFNTGILQLSKSVQCSIGLRTCSNQIYNARVQVQMKIHSPKYTTRIHFTLLLCKGWQRNVHRFTCITHMNSHCVTDKTFCLVAAMSLSFPSWLA